MKILSCISLAGMAILLAGCASDKEVGLCSELGLCASEKADCEGDDCGDGTPLGSKTKSDSGDDHADHGLHDDAGIH